MARVLWVACSQPGSLYPAVPVVLELLRRGHAVTALADAESEPQFRALGCGFVAAQRAGAVPPPPRPVTREGKLGWIQAYCGALFADVCGVLRGERFDVALCDPLETGATFAAEACGVPYAAYVHWGMDEGGADVPFRFHFWDREAEPGAAFVAWWNGLRESVGLGAEPRPVDEHRWYRSSPWLTLLLGLPELVEPRCALPPYALRVGPALWDPPSIGPLPAWLERIGVDRPAVLASVSTIRGSDAELVAAVGEAARGEGADVVATVAADQELPRLPANVRVAGFVPHGALVGRVQVVASHAGNGTVNRAACAGVPLLLCPGGRDQHQVARGAAAAGVAVTLDEAHRDAASTAAALHRLLHEEGFRERARQLAAAARGYDAAGSSATAIEALLAGARVPGAAS